MKSNPLVSVIIPVYNVEKFLPKCLDSVISQTYQNIEIICINDGSKDDSFYILKKHEEDDKRIKIIDIPNNGVSNARNIGLEHAKGDFILFVDADDWLERDCLEKLMATTDTEEGIIIHKCIRYTDMAIGKFFEKVSKEPWFDNTIFVLTSDHTNLSDHPEYQTDLGGFCSPIIIYEPGNTDLQPEMQDKIAQQIDILPTVMGMLHYPKSYFAFGIDLLNTPKEQTWAVNYLNGTYQYVKQGHVLQFDGQKSIGVYALTDSLMQHNLVNKLPQQSQWEREVKAIIQQYMERMTQDRLQP